MSDLNRRAFLDRNVRLAGLVGLASWGLRARADGIDPTSLEAKAAGFLRPRQSPDGSWSADRKEPGITALVVTALLRSKRAQPADPAIEKGLGYLEAFVDPRGGLAKAPHSVYSTSVALMAFQEANVGGKYDGLIRGAQGLPQGQPDRRDRGEVPGRPDLSAARTTAEGPAAPTSRTPRS